MQTSHLTGAHLRVARPSSDLAAVARFYCDGLGFVRLADFRDHDGFDGIMLGLPGAAYHLEFTCQPGHPVPEASTEENLLVFYVPEAEAWQNAIDRLVAHGYQPVPSYNPYWDLRGRTFVDPDGYRVVLQNADWPG